MKTNKSINGIIESLRSQITIEQVIDVLGLQKRLGLQKTGDTYQGDCITGHPSQNHHCFTLNNKNNLFHCFSCEVIGDIIELVQQSEGLGKLEAIKFLASQFVPDLLSQITELEDSFSEETKALYQRSTLYQAIYREGKKLLYEPIGKIALDYLINVRGYDPTILEKTDFIYWDTAANIKTFLEGKYPDKKDQIAVLQLIGGSGDDFRIAIPFRDVNGVITGFIKRAHEKDGFNGVRWDSTPGTKKSDIFGLNKIRNDNTLIVVEGYPDAVYFPALGLKNVVALGQAAFSKKYLEGLQSIDIHRIVLALDNDPTGLKNTEAICKEYSDSEIQVFVIDPAAYGKHKDPDEYVKANGLAAFQQLVADALSASEWYITRILLKYPITTDLGRSQAMMECFEYADSLPSAVDCEKAIIQMQKALGVTPEILQTDFQKVKDRLAKDQLIKNVSVMQSNIRKLIKEGKEDEATRLLVEKPSEYLSAYSSRKVAPEQSTVEFLTSKKARDAQRKLNDHLGYFLNGFPDIDTQLNGLQKGLYIIGAYPNVGKTAFMTSLCIDLLESNDDAAVLFFTMDDSRDTIINRFLAGKTEIAINEVQVAQNDPTIQTKIDDVYTWLELKAKENKFQVKEVNEALTIDAIEHTIRMHPLRDKLIVFIDGVYNVPMEGRYGSLREENIERANRSKQLVKLFNLPVIVTAELRKKQQEFQGKQVKGPTMHDLMESGKYGYNADVVWLISPQDEDKYRVEDEPVIEIAFEKNKLSSYRQNMLMKFKRAQSSMSPI